MLRLAALAFVLLLVPAAAQDFPALTGRVVDNANMLAPADRRALEEELEAFERGSGSQVVVATVPSLGGSDIEGYANRLFREWKLGRADEDDGILFLTARDDRKTRIEVGYGLEGTLTDTEASTIIQRVVLPEFREGRFDRGILLGTRSILDVLSGSDLPPPAPQAQRSRQGDGLGWFNILFLLFFFAGPLLFGGRGRRGRRRRGLRGPIILPGPGMGGGFGGGFGGGGGSSGGGGASGSW